MWESICLTLAATAGNNIGKVLQKKGTVILPPLSFKLKVLSIFSFFSALSYILLHTFGCLLSIHFCIIAFNLIYAMSVTLLEGTFLLVCIGA